MARIRRSDSIQANWPTVRRVGSNAKITCLSKGCIAKKETRTFWPKPDGDVSVLFVDLVIPPKVKDEFTHACRHGRINATHRERTFNFFRHSAPTGDARFSRGGRKLAVRDGMKVKLDKNEYATGAKDASEFA